MKAQKGPKTKARRVLKLEQNLSYIRDSSALEEKQQRQNFATQSMMFPHKRKGMKKKWLNRKKMNFNFDLTSARRIDRKEKKRKFPNFLFLCLLLWPAHMFVHLLQHVWARSCHLCRKCDEKQRDYDALFFFIRKIERPSKKRTNTLCYDVAPNIVVCRRVRKSTVGMASVNLVQTKHLCEQRRRWRWWCVNKKTTERSPNGATKDDQTIISVSLFSSHASLIRNGNFTSFTFCALYSFDKMLCVYAVVLW